MADNGSGIKDEEGTRQDWLELYNPGLEDANLDGWFLTDTATNLVKWRLPSVFVGANKYLVVFASGKTGPILPPHCIPTSSSPKKADTWRWSTHAPMLPRLLRRIHPNKPTSPTGATGSMPICWLFHHAHSRRPKLDRWSGLCHGAGVLARHGHLH